LNLISNPTLEGQMWVGSAWHEVGQEAIDFRIAHLAIFPYFSSRTPQDSLVLGY